MAAWWPRGRGLYRDDPEEGLVNRANGIGYTEMDIIIQQSRDGGKTWDGPHTIKPPLVGPSFETCHRVVELRDGRWLLPTSTWKGWNGEAPNGMKAIALTVSHDKGQTWPRVPRHHGHVCPRRALLGTISWGNCPTAGLIQVSWAFVEKTGATNPTPYVISADGKTFSKPMLTGLHGQTAKITVLPDGQILCLYRRNDKPGLWANLSRIEGDKWVNLEEKVMWQGLPGRA